MNTSGSPFVERLDAKNAALLAALDQSDYCRHFFSPDSSARLVEALVAGLLDEVAGYGGHLTIAVSTALGRLAGYPRFLRWVPPLMEALLGEVTHPEMARQDAVALSNGSRDAAKANPSPAAFGVAAVARFLCEHRHPLTHLGFFYLLEGTTSAIAPRLHAVLESRGIISPFIKLHATEDVEHAANLRAIMTGIVAQDPAMTAEIEYGYDCFAAAYPMPVWNAAAAGAVASRK